MPDTSDSSALLEAVMSNVVANATNAGAEKSTQARSGRSKQIHEALINHKALLTRHCELMSELHASLVKVETQVASHTERINGLCDAVAQLQVAFKKLRSASAPRPSLPEPADLLDITCNLSEDESI